MGAASQSNAAKGDVDPAESSSSFGRLLTSARDHWLWVALGALLTGLWAMFAYSHLLGLHFRAWELLSSRPSDDSLAQALRGPIMGWLQTAVLLLGLVAGAVGAVAAVEGRWRPLALYFGAMTAVMVAAEATQGLGQDESRPGSVDVVPAAGLILIAAIVMIELLLLLATARPRARH